MTTRPKLTPAQRATLAAAARSDLYRVGASSFWSPYGSNARHADIAVSRLVDLDYLEIGRTRHNHPLRRITDLGLSRLGLPARCGDPTSAARAAAALARRIAP
jgi:hypothetical protein